ncbi:MAG: L,D-transpeptidase family protein [Candidatus Pristimantibacillus sp.]
METTEDTLYLKVYVKQHPDNQMAWYLLGKQYMMLGKEAKANYCFIQAGDVYVAFEKKQHPLAEQPQEMLQLWNKRQRRKRLLSRAGAIAAVLLLLIVLLPSNKRSLPVESEPPTVAENAILPELAVVFVPLGERKPIGSAWDSLLQWPVQSKLTIAARMEEEDGWRKWTGRKKVLMTVNQPTEDTAMEVQMYDSATCNCLPGDPSASLAKLAEWSTEQEIRWTLASAIYQYNRLYDKWPDKLDQLIKPYPHNVLSGDKQEMRAMFNGLLSAVMVDHGATSKIPAKADNETGDSPTNLTNVANLQTGDQQWRKPLEIVIDKATHRLAVVNGDIIVRSYPVGLGGDRTPEGSFYISEKVKNPNGKDDGQFGSRGMTLSNTLYAIHGTDEPKSIGLDESLGCIRMSKEDVEELYDLVPLGTVVKVKNGTLPSKTTAPTERFQLEPKQNETNPDKIYRWLN